MRSRLFPAKSAPDFDRNFANLVAPPTDGSAKCLVRYKEHLVP